MCQLTGWANMSKGRELLYLCREHKAASHWGCEFWWQRVQNHGQINVHACCGAANISSVKHTPPSTRMRYNPISKWYNACMTSKPVWVEKAEAAMQMNGTLKASTKQKMLTQGGGEEKRRGLHTGILEGSLMYQGWWWVRMRRSHMYNRGLVCSVKAEMLWISMIHTLARFHPLSGRMEYTFAAQHKASTFVACCSWCAVSVGFLNSKQQYLHICLLQTALCTVCVTAHYTVHSAGTLIDIRLC